ncbi:aldo/keto reductase [uncultured Tateyamaria sp.]|uniref:aldo/keto reductase n=1 Tax=uncultured Tateyamaria sp. TaxID=455651 RepID=UPI00263063F8|nr:aldo/keto reductase [uncultured Tateyamaria sp.]
MIATQSIGETGVRISELGLGAATLGGIFEAVPDTSARDILDRAIDAGITYFDTAPFYGHGLSEHRVGAALRGRTDLTLSTKVGRLLRPGVDPDPGAWVDALPFTVVYDYSYDGIMRSFEASQHRLGRDKIDILYMHDIGDPGHETNDPALFDIAMQDGYRAMNELRRSGVVQAIGLGVNGADVLMRALDHGDWDVFLLAGRYTLLEQAPLDDLFPKCAEQSCRIVIGGPFNSGILAGGDTFDYGAIPENIARQVQQISAVARDHCVPLAAAALQFCRAHPLVTSTIPGPRNVGELDQVLDWWTHPIPTGFWSDLKSAGLLRPDAPTER